MTVTQEGVRFTGRAHTRPWALFFILLAEIVLSFFVYVSMTAQFIWPEKTRAATGIANVLSYEGRLMDENGSILGGTGEPYCFRFSLYDAVSGGTKVWPSGTPGQTLATTTDGIFNALIGQADTLDYNFYASDSVFLNVEVNTATSTNGSTCSGSWETLSPRQRVAATGYARSAENVYSTLLATDITNGRVQIGSGTGGASPKVLGLDVKNTNDYVGASCSTSGTLWYNSAISKALVCENGIIQTIGNSGATTTIAAINANSGTPATTGTVVFSNSNNVTFGINGNTITASIDNGVAPQRWKELAIRPVVSNQTNITAINGTPIFQPFYVDGVLTVSRLNWEMSRSTSGSNHFTVLAGIYSYVNATQISLLGSASGSFSNTATASVSGLRRFAVSGFDVSTLEPGGYVLGMIFTATATASMNYSLRGGLTNQLPVGAVNPGADSYNTATSYNWFPFFGRLTGASTAMPVSVADSQVRGQFTGASAALPWWVGMNND